jgi:DNA-binding CsgD family transcriptional regulator
VLEPDASVPEALRSHRWLLDALLRPFPNGSFNVFDHDLRYLYAAGTGLDWIGRSPDAVIGRRIEDVFPAEFVALVRPFYARAFAGETVTFPFPVFEREYSVHVWPLPEPDGTITAIVALALEAPTVPSVEVLSPQLREVAALIAAGLTDQQIAERLQIESGTVRTHVEEIMQRLGFATRTRIGVWAVARGLYRPPSAPL